MIKNKFSLRILQIAAVVQVVVIQYFMNKLILKYAEIFSYKGVDKNKLLSFYNFIGIIKFFLPYVVNELSVWLLVLTFFGRGYLFTLYMKISVVFLSITFISLITGFLTHTKLIIDFSTHFFRFGLGPSWPAVVMASFYYFDQQRKKSEK